MNNLNHPILPRFSKYDFKALCTIPEISNSAKLTEDILRIIRTFLNSINNGV